MAQLVNSIEVGVAHSRVGVIGYGDDAIHHSMYLSDGVHRADVLAAVS